jgi:hypothetical protein
MVEELTQHPEGWHVTLLVRRGTMLGCDLEALFYAGGGDWVEGGDDAA